jgi:hypothetical protein
MNRIISSLAIGLLLSLGLASRVISEDITNLIINETQLDEEINKACLSICQGNRREGKLERFLLERTDSNRFLAKAKVSLHNRHYIDSPEILGGQIGDGFTAYNYTVVAIAEGILDDKSCLLEIKNIHVENDQLGLSSLAKEQVGQTYHIDGCRKFTAGL